MSYLQLTYLYLAIILPAFALGTYLMAKRKGTSPHKRVGRLYMSLMVATGALTLFMPARVDPVLFSHFGYIHLLSVLTLFTVPAALYAARRGDIGSHRRSMLILYFGGLVIAGGFTFTPGRLLHGWVFGA